MNQAVILAGGKGTRLQTRLNGRPKPLIEIDGVPLLERQVLALRANGLSRLLLLVNYRADTIQEFCASRNNWGINIQCLDDGQPKGTAGAVLSILDRLDEELLIVYGDTMFDIDIARMVRYHRGYGNAGMTLFLHPNDHPLDSDLVEIDTSGYVRAFHPYPHPPNVYLRNLVNAAFYVATKKALLPWRNASVPLDFGKQLFPEMLKRGERLVGYISAEYIKDCGTPSRVDHVSNDCKRKVIERASLAHRQRAVFVDRDGTLNREVGYITKPEQLDLFEGVGEAVRQLNENQWKCIVITNQPVIARGDCTTAQLTEIHNKLETEVARAHGYVDRIYHCPHHPDRGFVGEISELKIACECRKPAIGLVKRAQVDFNLNLAECWFIGDSTSDIGAAQNSGVMSILVETGIAGGDSKHPYAPDMTVSQFCDAVKFIVSGYQRLVAIMSNLLSNVREGEDCIVDGCNAGHVGAVACALKREIRLRGVTCHVINSGAWACLDADGGVCRDVSAVAFIWAQLQSRSVAPVSIAVPQFTRGLSENVTREVNICAKANDVIVWTGLSAIELAKTAARAHTIIVVKDAQQDGNATSVFVEPNVEISWSRPN